VVIDANGAEDEVAERLRAAVAAWAPRPSRMPALLAGARSLLLAAGPLAAGVTAVGYQLAEAF
jgi:dTMP kinase